MFQEHRDLIDFFLDPHRDNSEFHSLYYNLLNSPVLQHMMKIQHPHLDDRTIHNYSRNISIELPFYTTIEGQVELDRVNFPSRYTTVLAAEAYDEDDYDDRICFFRDMNLSYKGNEQEINDNINTYGRRHNLYTLRWEGFVLTLDGHLHYIEKQMLAPYDSLHEIFSDEPTTSSWLGLTPMNRDHPFFQSYASRFSLDYLLPPQTGL